MNIGKAVDWLGKQSASAFLRGRKVFLFSVGAFLAVLSASAGLVPPDAVWPDLSRPPKAVGGGENDAAIVVGIGDYAFLADIPGARENAMAWYDYFTKTLRVPAANVKLLRDSDGTLEEIRLAMKQAMEIVRKDGKLWFVFIGHGAPGKNANEGLLVGVDAQQKVTSFYGRSLSSGELVEALRKSSASSIIVMIDGCFSGRTQSGETLLAGLQPLGMVRLPGAMDPRISFLTASKGDQFAGPLPGANRPAFSYLALGALRGWADADRDGKVTAGELVRYAMETLRATVHGREQTPDLTGSQDMVLASSAGEETPDLGEIAKQTAGKPTSELFRISDLHSVPSVTAPRSLDTSAAEMDFRNVDVQALKLYDETVLFDKGRALAEQKAAKWRELAKTSPEFAEKAQGRAAEWEQYAAERHVAEEARRSRLKAMDNDWKKLKGLLPLGVVSGSDKRRWAKTFVQAYGKTVEENPYVNELAAFLSAGTGKVGPADETGVAEQAIDLQGIVAIPEGNKAIINGKMVGEGDSVGGVKVIRIAQKSVVLEYRGNQFTKKLSTP